MGSMMRFGIACRCHMGRPKSRRSRRYQQQGEHSSGATSTGADSKFVSRYVGTLGGAIIGFFMGPLFWLWAMLRSLFPKKRGPTRAIVHT
jgi:hypothetical protein